MYVTYTYTLVPQLITRFILQQQITHTCIHMHFVLQCSASRLHAAIYNNNKCMRAAAIFFCTRIALMQNIRFICDVIRDSMLAICWTCDKRAQRHDNGDISGSMTCHTNTCTQFKYVCVCGEKVLKKYIKHGYAHFCNSLKWNFNMLHCHISHSFINAMYTCQQRAAAAAAALPCNMPRQKWVNKLQCRFRPFRSFRPFHLWKASKKSLLHTRLLVCVWCVWKYVFICIWGDMRRTYTAHRLTIVQICVSIYICMYICI